MLGSRVVAVLLAAACGGSSPTSYGGGNPPPPPSGGGSASVSMANYSFSPSPLTIKAGTTVQWANGGTVAHTTTSDNGTWDSGSLGPPGMDAYGMPTAGQSYSHTFTTAGTFAYHCSFHQLQGMKGTITVTP